MPSNLKPSLTEDSLPTSADTKKLVKSPPCVTCRWLEKQQNGIQKELLSHMQKFHPPTNRD